MRRIQLIAFALTFATACGGGQTTEGGSSTDSASSTSGSEAGGGAEESGDEDSGGAGEFQLSESTTAGDAHGAHPSQIESTRTHAAMRLFVVDPERGPISGIVIKLNAPDGSVYYTDETDSAGYAEVLVPAGVRYEMEYLSLGRRDIAARVEVPPGPRQDIRLTIRYRSRRRPRPTTTTLAPEETPAAEPEPEPGFVLEGILFNTGHATIQEESFPRLDRLVEYMTHRRSARIRISGHTDSVGDPGENQALSEARAEAVRDYVVSHGIDASRIEAVGYGATQPVAPNDTEEGRQRNRRIEAVEIP